MVSVCGHAPIVAIDAPIVVADGFGVRPCPIVAIDASIVVGYPRRPHWPATIARLRVAGRRRRAGSGGTETSSRIKSA